MKRLAGWLCILALLAPFGCASEVQAPSAERSAPAPAPSGVGDGETLGTSAKAEPHDAAASSSARASAMTPISTAGPASGTPAAGAASGSTPSPAPSAPSSSSPMTPAPSVTPLPPSAAGAGGSGASAGEAASKDAALPSSRGGGNSQGAPGVLTAGAWDDNLNFDRFTHYREQLAKQQLAGMLASTAEEHDAAHDEFSQEHGGRDTLDVSLVIDTTGSMGDEIRYLQSEFTALSSAIEAKYPNAQQRWSLVVYRDSGDEYVTRWYDFRDNAADFRDKLGLQGASGGGDFPEAPDAALAAMAQLAWRTDAKTARLAFWVADAPHHNDKADAMLKSVRGAHAIGVHVYPVASSGVDELTELTMRSTAQLTGGRYLFLTDDSGVGGAHKEPTIPCYVVTHLDKAILRMVDIELSGEYKQPAEDDIIRTSGEPKDGRCDLSSGEIVELF